MPMFQFLIQLAITAAFGYYASQYAQSNALYHGPPAHTMAAFVLPFLVYKLVCRGAGPVAGRLAALAILVAYVKTAGFSYSGGLFAYSVGELVIIGVAIVLAVFLPGGSHRKLHTNASKDAIARGEEWVFEGRRFAVHIDFKAATARLIARKPLCIWCPGSDGNLHPSEAAHADLYIPLHQFNLGIIHQHTKTSVSPNAAGGWFDGKLISVNLPGGTQVSAPTGVSDITFHHRGAHEASCRVAGLKVANEGPEQVEVVLFKVRNREVARFQQAWAGVAERVRASYTAYGAGVEEKGRALRLVQREQEAAAIAAAQATEQERLAGLAALAQDRVREMLDDAGLRGDFKRSAQSEGRVDWLIATDRDGRGLIFARHASWRGSFAGAKARILAGAERCLEIELQDRDYEREHVMKHRIRLLHDQPEATLQEWCDRVTILGMQAAVS